MEKQTFLEKVAGNTLTNLAVASAVAASSSYFPLAPLLPVLTGKLATDRYRKRVEKALEEIDVELSKHEEKINQLSDAQFKFINEGVISILFNTNDQKIEYLRRAVLNSINTEELKDDNAIVLSRILRDISVNEIQYLMEIKDYEQIIVYGGNFDSGDITKLHITPNDTQQISLLTGLAYLGILSISGSGFGGTINYKILPIAHNLIDLVLEKEQKVNL